MWETAAGLRRCGAVRLEEKIIVSCLAHAGGEADFTDWRPEHPLSVQEREKEEIRQKLGAGQIPLLFFDKAAWQANTLKDDDELSKEPQDKALLELLDSMSDRELAYLCIGRYQDEGSKSVVGNAGFAVAGSAEGPKRLYEAREIPGICMADGPAGLRLSRRYGEDEQGVYAVGDEVPAAFLDFH